MRLLRALIVERRFSKRLYLRTLLAAIGFDCVSAADADAALSISNPYSIDLIVIDGGAPKNAPALVVALTHGAFGKNPPPVIVYAEAPIKDVAVLAAAHCAVIEAPLGPKTLFDAVDKAFSDAS